MVNRDNIRRTLVEGFQLSLRRFKLENGGFWGLLFFLIEPLLFFSVIIFVLTFLLDYRGDNYIIYLLIGLIMFNFFRISCIPSTRLFRNRRKGLRLENLVVSNVLLSIYSHFVEIVILICFLIYYGMPIGFLFFYPLIFLMYLFFVTGFILALATYGYFYKKLTKVVSLSVKLLWFLTPTFYYIGDNPYFITINLFNPLYYFLRITRDLILNSEFSSIFIYSTLNLVSIYVLVCGIYIFYRNREKLLSIDDS